MLPTVDSAGGMKALQVLNHIHVQRTKSTVTIGDRCPEAASAPICLRQKAQEILRQGVFATLRGGHGAWVLPIGARRIGRVEHPNRFYIEEAED